MFGFGLPNALGLPGLSVRRGGGAALDPLTLSPVYMLDTADRDTMYLTSAGTTKVASDGDTIGTLLEVSQWDDQTLAEVLAGQPDRIGDPNLDNPSSWDNNNNATVSGGKATWAAAPSNSRIATSSGLDLLTAGAFYQLTLTIATLTAGALRLADSAGNTLSPDFSTPGVKTAIVKGQGLSPFLRCFGTTTAEVETYSIKQIPGSSSTQATAAACPKWYGPNLVRFDGTDDRHRLTIKPTAAGTIAAKIKPTTAGRFLIGCQNATPDRCYLGLDGSGQLAGGIGSDSSATIHGSEDIRGTTGVAVLTWDASTVKLYWNGAEVYSGAKAGSIPTATAFSLGALNANGTDSAFFAGDLYPKPFILTTAATPAQVAQITTALS